MKRNKKKNTEKFSDKAKNQKDADIFQTTHHRITQQWSCRKSQHVQATWC